MPRSCAAPLELRGSSDASSSMQPIQGFVIQFFAYDGFGIIQPVGGGEVFFHRSAVRHDAFARLGVGVRVSFREEADVGWRDDAEGALRQASLVEVHE
jgi:cold shock CspA family protein